MSGKAGDEHMGEWVYCTQHVRPHTTGWCTVGERDKIRLRATTYTEAAAEVRAAGWHIYNTDDGLPHLRDFDEIRAAKERHEAGLLAAESAKMEPTPDNIRDAVKALRDAGTIGADEWASVCVSHLPSWATPDEMQRGDAPMPGFKCAGHGGELVPGVVFWVREET